MKLAFTLLLLVGLARSLGAETAVINHAVQRDTRPYRACVLLMRFAHWDNPEPLFLPALRYWLYQNYGMLVENPLAPERISLEHDHLWYPDFDGLVTFEGRSALVQNNRLGNVQQSDQAYQRQAHLETAHWYPAQLASLYLKAGTEVLKGNPSLAWDPDPTKDRFRRGDPQYWEVPLTESVVTELANFDAVFVNTHRIMDLDAEEQSWLQRFLDQGGVLFLENSHGCRIKVRPGSTASGNPLDVDFFLQFQFMDDYPSRPGDPQIPPNDQPPYEHAPNDYFPVNPGWNLNRKIDKYLIDSQHPLMQNLNVYEQGLGYRYNFLGDVRWADHLLVPFPTRARVQELLRSDFVNAVTGDRQPALVVGRYGSGAIVLSGVDMIDDISMHEEQWAGTDPTPERLPDFIFMKNLLEWKRTWAMWRGNPRHSGQAEGDVSTTLEIEWQFPAESDNGFLGPVYSSPVTARGIVYQAAETTDGDPLGLNSSTGALFALDAVPAADRDGDGNWDDGYDDYLGAPYDLIWGIRLPAPPGYCTPAVVDLTWLDNPAAPTDSRTIQGVFLTMRDPGSNTACVQGYYATLDPTVNATTRLDPGDPLWPTPLTYTNVAAISSPVVHNGMLYFTTVDNAGFGYVHAVNVVTGNQTWPDGWVYPDTANYGAESPLPFGAPNPALPPSAPAVTILVNPNTGLSYTGAIVGAPNGRVYSLSADPALYRVSVPVDPPAGVAPGSYSYYQIVVDPTVPTPVVKDSGGTPLPNTAWVLENGSKGIFRIDRAYTNQGLLIDYQVQAYDSSGNPVGSPEAFTDVSRDVPLGNQANYPLPWGAIVNVWSSPTMVRDDAVSCSSAALPAVESYISGRAGNSNQMRWNYPPSALLPTANPYRGVNTPRAFAFWSSPAYADETVVAPGTLLENGVPFLGTLAGLDPDQELQIGFSVPPANVATVRLKDHLHVTATAPNVGLDFSSTQFKSIAVHPQYYRVDFDRRVITFHKENAHDVGNRASPPASLGPIYGRRVYVVLDLNSNGRVDNGETQSATVPSLTRWEFVPYLVRVPTYPINTAAGVLVEGTPFPAGAIDAANGLLDFHVAWQADAAWGTLIGREVGIEYDDVDGRSYRGTNALRRTVPPPYGPLVSSPVVADRADTTYVGTMAVDWNGSGTIEANEQGRLLALGFDYRRGVITPQTFPEAMPTFRDRTATQIDFYASPAVGEDRVFASPSLVTNQGPSGVLYALGTGEYLIADSHRLLRMDGGGNVQWQCLGGVKFNEWSEPEVYEQAGSVQGDPRDEVLLRFEDIAEAKALREASTNQVSSYLVVDAGAHRVVEVNDAGTILWPRRLAWNPNNQRHRVLGLYPLDLDRPTGAERWSVVEPVPTFDANGNLEPYDPNVTALVTYTIIADSGHNRILEVRSWTDPNGTPRYDFWDRTDPNNPTYRLSPAVLTRENYPYLQVKGWYEIVQDNPPTYDWVYLCRLANPEKLAVLKRDANGVWWTILNDPTRWFTLPTFPGLRHFELFDHYGYRYLSLIDNYLTKAYPGEPDPGNTADVGRPALRLYTLSNVSAASPYGTPAIAVDQRNQTDPFIITASEYRYELAQFYAAELATMTADEQAQFLDAKVWNPVSVSKVPNRTQLVVVNAGHNVMEQTNRRVQSRSEILVMDYEEVRGARIRDIIPDNFATTYAGTGPAARPKCAARL